MTDRFNVIYTGGGKYGNRGKIKMSRHACVAKAKLHLNDDEIEFIFNDKERRLAMKQWCEENFVDSAYIENHMFFGINGTNFKYNNYIYFNDESDAIAFKINFFS